MIERLRKWLIAFLGLDVESTTAAHRHEAVTLMLDQVQDTLNAMQKDKLKVYIQQKAKPVAVDFETSQVLTMDEFKES